MHVRRPLSAVPTDDAAEAAAVGGVQRRRQLARAAQIGSRVVVHTTHGVKRSRSGICWESATKQRRALRRLKNKQRWMTHCVNG